MNKHNNKPTYNLTYWGLSGIIFFLVMRVLLLNLEINDNRRLESAICEVYLNGERFKKIDIIEENKIKGRKKPKKQIEHKDTEYLFITDKIDFNMISDFKVGEINIRLILTDSLKNTYEIENKIIKVN